MSPDRQHFHHRMLSLGLNQKQVALISYSINILLGILALIILFVENVNILIILLITFFIIIFMIIENYIYTKHKLKKKRYASFFSLCFV